MTSTNSIKHKLLIHMPLWACVLIGVLAWLLFSETVQGMAWLNLCFSYFIVRYFWRKYLKKRGDVRVGVRMFSYYKDLYSVKLDELTIHVDQDSDGINDDIETLMGSDPLLADSDNDGIVDGSDLWPLDQAQTDKTRIKNRGVIDTQLFRVGDVWSVLVTNLSPNDVIPTVALSGLAADAYVSVADSSRSFASVADEFTDTTSLPAFASRLYQLPAAAYTAPDPSQSIYPSTLTAWVIPGYQELPTDVETLAALPSMDAVTDWEVSHADVTFGGGFDEHNEEMKAAVGYMYNQMLSFNPGTLEMALRERAEQNGVDYEDFMLHFAEDTELVVDDTEKGSKTPFYGVPTIMGYTRSATDSGVPLLTNTVMNAGVWDESANGGALYVYLPEAFDQLQLSLSNAASDGELVIEYPSTVDSHGLVSQWKTMSITDGTNNLGQDGTVYWTPPADWVRAATYHADDNTGQFFANTKLAEGGAYYLVRLKWQNGVATSPRLDGLSLKRWLSPINEGSDVYLIPGWDAANDRNNDGYIDEAEFAIRSNTAASARFRYESRVVPLGQMWSAYSSFIRPNLSSSVLRQYLADYYSASWREDSISGAYNDDFFKQIGSNIFEIVSGGQLSEYNGQLIQDKAVQTAYIEDFKATLNTIKTASGSEWISANISAENLFTDSQNLSFLEPLDAVLREDYLLPSLGLSGYFGVNKTWDNFALAARDVKSVITMHHRYGRAQKLENTQDNWAKDSEAGLALYYLMNVKDKTYYHAWNSTFQYGSNNTFEAPTSFWKAGVPKNYAYQASDMLKVDIGQPSDDMPSGKEAMKYMVRTQVPLSDYTIIGDTTDTVLSHAEIGEAGEVAVTPSYIYYLQRSSNEVVTGAPAEMVLARQYSNGLVLYRTDLFGGNATFMETTSELMALPGTYQRVNTDGTLGEPITQISLKGYEGAILISAEEQTGNAAISTLQNSTLGTIPSSPLLSSRPVTELGIEYHELAATASDASYNRELCDVSAYWPAEQVTVGGRASGNNQDVCKVQAQTDDGALKFLTKWPSNNSHYPVTSSPAWAQFRFPVSQGHTAKTVEYDVSWYKLFGSEPTNCHPNDLNAETGDCTLDVGDDWQSNVPAGLYLSWATPGDSEALVTGPHDPIQAIGYSSQSTFQVDVPESYQDVDELVVSLITYNQYTKACEANNAASCTTHENENLELHAVRLKTSRAFNPEKQPAQAHPRILGNDEEWAAYWQPFDDLACVESSSDSDWGSVFNAKNIWDKGTKGYVPCKDEQPESLQAVSDASYYLTPAVTATWNRDRALRVLFLLRELKQCHANNESADCLYSAEETQQLETAFISAEMTRFETISWDWGYACFDLGTEPEMKFWSIFVDVFWSDLSAANKTTIDETLAEKADCYLAQYEAKHWSIFNGNNWTPILGKGAMYWAIAYYHEDARAKVVLEKVLESLWLHRDFYLDDGAYMEGIIEYTNVSYSNLREINNLMMQGFGIPLESVRWETTEKTADWYLDFMAPDGAMVDFGDSWDKLGWYTLDPLHMLLWEEMIGEAAVGSVIPDACQVREYFSNKWFQKGLDDPWAIQPSMARDWIALVDSCDSDLQAGTHINLFENAVTGAIRQYLPGTSAFAQQDGLKYQQADQTYLAISGIPNDFPHRELDFGALVWSAYGNRLLYDFSYGDIAKTAQGRPYLINDGDTLLYDNLALGANTLVVEDATQSNYSSGNYNDDTINSSQIYGERGTLEAVNIGGYDGLRLDSKAVYGANDDELGWLRYFDRWMLSLEDGNFLVIDAFAVKDDRPAANIQEYWHTAATAETAESCGFTHQNVTMTLESDSALKLVPECARLHRTAESSVVGKIIATSKEAGSFTIDEDIIEYPNRVGGITSRRRARFVPETNVREDVRVFLLQASPNDESLTDITLQQSTNCDAVLCFDLSRAGSTQRIEFTRSDDQYMLSQVSPLPDAFSFESQSNVDLETSVISSVINISGIDTAVAISVSNGEYRINNGEFTSISGTVSNGQSVQLRQTSAATFETQTDTTLSIGGISARFSTTTKANTADITAPVITTPNDLILSSKGYRTRFTLANLQQAGSATDDVDGVLDITLDSVNDKAPTYRAKKTAILLRPGRHTLTWSATDSSGNTTTATQQVDVLPRASFLVNQSASEGDTVSLTVVLNGDAPAYPVVIPFTISGSAETTDYQLTPDVMEVSIEQPTDNTQATGSIEVALLEDDVAELAERIFFSMTDDLQNAVKGRKTRHRVTIAAQNLPPRARIRVSQNAVNGNRVYQNDGEVRVKAIAKDPNKDSMTYEWSSQTLVDSAMDADPSTFEVNPQTHAVGWHTVSVKVSDGTLFVEKQKLLRIKSGAAVVADQQGDEEGNGIPDYLEDAGLGTNQLVAGQDTPIEVDPGLVLETGPTAQWNDHYSGSISEAQLKAYQEAEYGTYQADTHYTPTLILDYQVHELEEQGSTVSLVVNLVNTLNDDSVMRKFNPVTGWQDFVVDENNHIETAISHDGNCPTDGSITYASGLQSGASCLQISIQDGGPNDADGIANGTIIDPIAISEASDTTVPSDTTASSDNSGGGSFGLHLLALLLMGRAFWQKRKLSA